MIPRTPRSHHQIGTIGLEWLYRLCQEPRRLWRRYLVEGPRFFGIIASKWQLPRSSRIIETTDRS